MDETNDALVDHATPAEGGVRLVLFLAQRQPMGWVKLNRRTTKPPCSAG